MGSMDLALDCKASPLRPSKGVLGFNILNMIFLRKRDNGNLLIQSKHLLFPLDGNLSILTEHSIPL